MITPYAIEANMTSFRSFVCSRKVSKISIISSSRELHFILGVIGDCNIDDNSHSSWPWLFDTVRNSQPGRKP